MKFVSAMAKTLNNFKGTPMLIGELCNFISGSITLNLNGGHYVIADRIGSWVA